MAAIPAAGTLTPVLPLATAVTLSAAVLVPPVTGAPTAATMVSMAMNVIIITVIAAFTTAVAATPLSAIMSPFSVASTILAIPVDGT